MLPQFDVKKALAEYEKRTATISEVSGIEQHGVARSEQISARSRLEIIADRIATWLRALDNLPDPTEVDEQKLLPASKKFALSVWAHPALAAGWTDAELFALPVGLIPQMALRNLHLLDIDESGATLMTGRGLVETYEPSRFRSGRYRPWWQW